RRSRKMTTFDAQYKKLQAIIGSIHSDIDSIKSKSIELNQVASIEEISTISTEITNQLVEVHSKSIDYRDAVTSLTRAIESMDDEDKKIEEINAQNEFLRGTDGGSGMEQDPSTVSEIVSSMKEKIEFTIVAAKSRLNALLQVSIPPPSNVAPTTSTDASSSPQSNDPPSSAFIASSVSTMTSLTQKLVSIEAHIATSQSNPTHHPNLSLPAIKLESFDGSDITRWPAYKYQLDSLILSQSHLNERRKSDTLLGALQYMEDTIRTELEDVTITRAISERHQGSVSASNNFDSSPNHKPKSSTVEHSIPSNGKSTQGPTCVFCGEHAYSGECALVTSLKDRIDILKQKSFCFCCFSSKHTTHSCVRKCSACAGKHNKAICEKVLDASANTATTLDPHPGRLYTTRAILTNPDPDSAEAFNANIHLDHGSQVTLITSDAVKRLSLA
ncbi:hypothetical protein PMAYCL1PPCAC_10946, partial [Pristionchus mayeri]